MVSLAKHDRCSTYLKNVLVGANVLESKGHITPVYPHVSIHGQAVHLLPPRVLEHKDQSQDLHHIPGPQLHHDGLVETHRRGMAVGVVEVARGTSWKRLHVMITSSRAPKVILDLK